MPKYYRSIRTKKLLALLVRSGFVSRLGSKHGKYVRDNDNITIIITRHRTIAPGTSKQICEYLEKAGIPESQLKKLF